MASTSSRRTPAVSAARSSVGTIASRCAREATSGTTPPNRACSSTELATASASSVVPRHDPDAGLVARRLDAEDEGPSAVRRSSRRTFCRVAASDREVPGRRPLEGGGRQAGLTWPKVAHSPIGKVIHAESGIERARPAGRRLRRRPRRRSQGRRGASPALQARDPLTPRTHFVMKPDGSSGLTKSGEGIPNIDSVKATIRTYYNASSDGIADKTKSPYITEVPKLLNDQQPYLAQSKSRAQAGHRAGHRRHDALDLRHGGRGDALQLRPDPPEHLGAGAALPGHAGHGRRSSTRPPRWATPSSASPAATTTRRPRPWPT